MGPIDPKITELWPFLFGQFELSPIGQFGREPDFQEFFGGRTKMTIAQSESVTKYKCYIIQTEQNTTKRNKIQHDKIQKFQNRNKTKYK